MTRPVRSMADGKTVKPCSRPGRPSAGDRENAGRKTRTARSAVQGHRSQTSRTQRKPRLVVALSGVFPLRASVR